jgi:hypothetical protein
MNRSGRLALLAAVTLVNFASAALAADAPTPTGEKRFSSSSQPI